MSENKKTEPKKIPGLCLRKNGIYQKVLVIDGKKVYFYSKDPEEIFTKIAAYQTRVSNGPTFKDVAKNWEWSHFDTIEHNTKKGYAPALRRATKKFGEYYIKDIDANDINGYIKEFASDGYAYKTVVNQLLIIRMIFDYACGKGVLKNNPCLYVKVPKGLKRSERRFPTDEELKLVKENVDKPFGLFFYFILYTGCRLGEALAMQWGDIDFEKKEIHITKSVYYNQLPKIKYPKTNAGKRTIMLLDLLHDTLLPLKGKDDELIFSKNGKLLRNTEAWQLMEGYRKETGTKITPHELRHGFATMLYEAGVDVKTAQNLLGHAQSSTTLDIYTHLRDRQKDLATQLMNEYIKCS